jgi:hypothetical protein
MLPMEQFAGRFSQGVELHFPFASGRTAWVAGCIASKMTSLLTSRLVDTAGRIEFLSYGLVVHLLLLPTPPHSDAVIFGYRLESV